MQLQKVENVHIVRYEDLKLDFHATFKSLLKKLSINCDGNIISGYILPNLFQSCDWA